MRKDIIVIFLSIILVVLFIPITGASQTYTGVISVDSVAAEPGDKFAVNIHLSNNNIDFSGLSVPLKYDSDQLYIDSVSFENSILTADFLGIDYNDPLTNTVRIIYMPDFNNPGAIPFISDTEGIIASIHFGVNYDSLAGAISLDSVYIDSLVGTGDIHFVEQIELTDNTGQFTYQPEFIPGEVSVEFTVGIEDERPKGLPAEFHLAQNYPNPFNPMTTIEFSLPAAGKTKLEVFNILGQTVATLVDQRLAAGIHQIQFDGGNHPSGIYFYRLNHALGSQTRKMVMIK